MLVTSFLGLCYVDELSGYFVFAVWCGVVRVWGLVRVGGLCGCLVFLGCNFW